MAPRTRVVVPRQGRGPTTLDELERAVASTADLVLKLTALAERYELGSGSRERVTALREVASRGRTALLRLVTEERQPVQAAPEGWT
jgi:hypothetical protein